MQIFRLKPFFYLGTHSNSTGKVKSIFEGIDFTNGQSGFRNFLQNNNSISAVIWPKNEIFSDKKLRKPLQAVRTVFVPTPRSFSVFPSEFYWENTKGIFWLNLSTAIELMEFAKGW